LDNTDNPPQNKSTGAKRGCKKNDHDDNYNTDNLQSKSTSIKKSYKKKQKETDAPPSSQIISELLKDDDILNDDDHGLNDDDEDAAEIGLIVKIHQNQIFKFKMT
jgi:hypothetical protein